MSIEENKVLAERFIDAFHRRDAAAVRDVCAPDLAKIVIEDWMPAGDRRWADRTMEITEMVAEDDRVWMRLANSGRQTAEWLGLPATGKPSSGRGVGFLRLGGGEVVEFTALWDELARAQQIGAKLVLGG